MLTHLNENGEAHMVDVGEKAVTTRTARATGRIRMQKETLDALRERGLLLGIGSSSKNTKFILSRIGLGDYFDKISDGTNITRSKPDPEVFLKAADYLGLKPADCLVVEDAKAGIEAARAAGMDSAAIGDAAGCGLATWDLSRFSDLLACVD